MLINKMSSFKCSVCDRVSNNKWNMQDHINRVCSKVCEKSEDAYVIEAIVKVECDICNKEFDTLKNLTNHKERCFKKRTVVVDKFIDPEGIKELVDGQSILIASLSNTVKKLVEENKDLKKRIEKLEVSIKVENDNKQRGYEELEEIDEDDEDADINPCYSSTLDIFKPKKYEEILKKFDRKNYKKGKLITRFTGLQMVDKKGNIIDGIEASENGIFDGKQKFAYGDTTLLIKEIECPYPAKYRHFKTNECYCEKHFDLDTGKPNEKNVE